MKTFSELSKRNASSNFPLLRDRTYPASSRCTLSMRCILQHRHSSPSTKAQRDREQKGKETLIPLVCHRGCALPATLSHMCFSGCKCSSSRVVCLRGRGLERRKSSGLVRLLKVIKLRFSGDVYDVTMMNEPGVECFSYAPSD